MKAKIITLENKASGEISLSKEVFGLPTRKDILHRVVNWQLAKRQAGTHKTKERSEITGSRAKPFRQKGTGRARQGVAHATQMRGGATAFGPRVRSHAHALPKKIRALGLKTALSSKQTDGKLSVLKSLDVKDAKTSVLAKHLAALGHKSILIIGGEQIDESFKRAVANIAHVDVLPVQGANVYDILKREQLLLTEDAVKSLQERLA